ncbi:isochorismatase family protein [Corynebacterium uropygiale]|uniref:nicotinamidase n=1 Tax=Corynebacterium uropygiale TaxID=1775911 RepID=A0A9X1QUV9_9CORY|nr:isochorismatase family protein [Corynebacterium uropygiale]MCF4007440.1 isochorismatase family protein [Corynebacterium uropygiale]
MAQALIIVDAQNDFCPGGALATARGAEIATLIGSYQASESAEAYDVQIATKDWHVDPGDHFDTWPPHCVAGSTGADFHEAIREDLLAAVFLKGRTTAAYSGFEGEAEGMLLAPWLRKRGITHIDVCGIATDHCVRATVLDGVKAGFDVRVLSELCAAVDNSAGDAALEEMRRAGASVI